jgi:hypothetical protein
MREEIEYHPFPLKLCEIEGQAKEKRISKKIKTFSKFQINSRKQIPSKFQI